MLHLIPPVRQRNREDKSWDACTAIQLVQRPRETGR